MEGYLTHGSVYNIHSLQQRAVVVAFLISSLDSKIAFSMNFYIKGVEINEFWSSNNGNGDSF